MILSDFDIIHSLRMNWIGIKPFTDSQIQPASYDVRLGNKLRVFSNHNHKTIIDPEKDQSDLMDLIEISIDNPFQLNPGDFVLGATKEYFIIPNNVAARLEGKSSLGRFGLVIHSTAGWFDPGFKGTGTLELGNISRLPILLRPGMLIGQMAFMEMTSPAMNPYGSDGLNSKYQGQIDPEASQMHKNYEMGDNYP